MNINDYFDPVSLERPMYTLMKNEFTFSHNIDIHTPDTPVKNIGNYDIAIIGAGEEQNAYRQGSADSPARIREKLYLLTYIGKKTRIADLGNLKITGNINDTYFALRDVLQDLREKKVIALVLGGSQDLTLGMSMAFSSEKMFWNLTTFDARLDFGFGKEKLNSRNYLDSICKEKAASRLNYINIGQQSYFTPLKVLDKLENLGHEAIRLGIARSGMEIIEPVLRDSDIVSVDMSCVRQSDAPGVTVPGPNGFTGEELCQIARYAGASPKISAFGIFDIMPKKDFNEMTSHLAAQAAWYFMEGFAHRIEEDPRLGNSRKYMVETTSPNEHIVFYKSLKTERWWFELPVKEGEGNLNHIVACSRDDYDKACSREIPDRWWKRMRRYS